VHFNQYTAKRLAKVLASRFLERREKDALFV